MVQNRSRKEQVFDFIVEFARENNGITPSTRQIAQAFKLSQTRIYQLITKLVADDRLEWVDRERYKVVDSEWKLILPVQLSMFT